MPETEYEHPAVTCKACRAGESQQHNPEPWDPEVALDVWLMIEDDEDDEDPLASHEANTFVDGARFRVEWYNNSVGLVTEVMFDTYEAAEQWLTAGGYADYTS